MKVSKLIVKTLREAPSGVELPSHIFLLRGGYIKPMGSGLISILPMGKRVIDKVCDILREEMEILGGQAMDLPLINPAKLWKMSGRFQAIGDELLRFKDRTGQNMVLAMTHEEGVTDLIKGVVSSYKQLPFMVYQIKEKYRDEPRARGGLIRVKEFQMKDGYSFHADNEDLDKFYWDIYRAYEKIFSRVGIDPIIVESDLGIMGGKQAHEFMLESENGEDSLILSEDGKYKANRDIATFDRESSQEPPLELEEVHTPEKTSIESVADYLKVPVHKTMKAVMYGQKDKFVLVLIRGDLDVSETKIKNYLGVKDLLPAEEESIRALGLVPGYASAYNLKASEKLFVLLDESITAGANFIGGANKENFHLKNLNFGRDFESEHIGDFAQAKSGYKCKDSDSPLKEVKGIEIGNIFKLGTKFSESLKAEFLDREGKSLPFVMGCYGIGVGRLMAAVVENSHDKFGPIWPKSIAPYQVHLLNIGSEPEIIEACDTIYSDLQKAGFEVLYDDRDERPGVKFKDADLWGIPLRLAVSSKTWVNHQVEFKLRNSKGFELTAVDALVEKIQKFYSED